MHIDLFQIEILQYCKFPQFPNVIGNFSSITYLTFMCESQHTFSSIIIMSILKTKHLFQE